MSYDFNSGIRTAPRTVGASFDAALRAHMVRVYNHMTAGLVVTGIVAFLVSTSPAMLQAIFGTPLRYLVIFAPLAFVLVMSFGIQRLSLAALTGTFYGFSVAMGLSLSTIFLVYTGGSIAQVFFISAATFLGMSLYGYTTKADLTSWGSFGIMAVFGIILASLVNMFLHSAGMGFAISVIGVIAFTALTAYDTQKIKEQYSESWGAESNGKLALMGALNLYLDFINLFMMLLRLLGNRR
ncbi:MAG TPA: Bax inhibitor-1/YccA family protein [Alphaproteobacteria bacterium]|nr:Bax inhibitor-1/YccA family protein [Alphaproteobacteria bacterium]